MFERYTEKARRVIFYARYEASQFGSPYIETEHLLLGLLREDKMLVSQVRLGSFESLREKIETHTIIREKIPTSVDLPLSNECKRVLAYAAEEAERLEHKHIGTEHLLLGMLREKNCFAAGLLKENGANLEKIREQVGKLDRKTESAGQTTAQGGELGSGLFRDLTQSSGPTPVIERDVEIEALFEILCSRAAPSVVLVGEPGSGRNTVVEILAQKIASGAAPQCIADKRILAFSGPFSGAAMQTASAIKGISEKAILFVGNLAGQKAIATIEKQMIATATPAGYTELAKSAPWVRERFRPIFVDPLSTEETLRILDARKAELERFHGVTYSQETLALAAHSAERIFRITRFPARLWN